MASMLAEELVRRPVRVLVATGGATSALAAKAATTTIPIVFSSSSDPVKFGLVASLNRPGGNATGVSFLLGTLGSKRLELLRELLPGAKLIAALMNPDNPGTVAEHSKMYLIKSEPNYFGRHRDGFGIECKLNVPTTGYDDLPLVITEEGLYVAGFHHWGEGTKIPLHRLTVRSLADEIADGVKALIEG